MSELANVVELAKANAWRQHQRRREQAAACADLLENLPKMLVAERHARGVSQTAAARQAGVNLGTWQSTEQGLRAGTVKTLVPLLRWLSCAE